MNKPTKYTLWISGIALAVATVGRFNMDKLYSPIVFFVSLNTILLGLAWVHLKKRNSNTLLGGYILALGLIYDLVHYEPALGLEPLFRVDFEHWTLIFRTILTITIYAIGIFYLLKGGDGEMTLKRTGLKISLTLMLCLLIIEAPVYNIHGDFGGNLHGHNLIDGFHFH